MPTQSSACASLPSICITSTPPSYARAQWAIHASHIALASSASTRPSRHHHAVQNSGLERPFPCSRVSLAPGEPHLPLFAATRSVQRAQASVPKHTSDTTLCTVLALDGQCTSITGDNRVMNHPATFLFAPYSLFNL
ncbi:hypothetical protein L1887_57709 [Cichorium endivia]|nr:hypothetical protein L1887_57709 [Cichorium endivia]